MNLNFFTSQRTQQGLRTFPFIALLCATFLLAFAPRLQAQSSDSFVHPTPTARIVSHVSDRVLTVVHGSTHPAIYHAIDNGRLAAGSVMGDLILVLKRSDEQQTVLDQFNAAQYDPASPEFHHWLTPEEFGASYGVSAADLETITNWLTGHGFSIDEIPPSHTSIRFSGNAGQVETAFHTEMHAITVNGKQHIANNSEIQIPSAFAGVVVGVKALHDFFPKPLHHSLAQMSRSTTGNWTMAKEAGPVLPTGAAKPAADVSPLITSRPDYSPGNGWELLVPYDMATIYNYKSLWTASTPIIGTGQTIALAGTSNIVLSDVATFRSATGLPANVPTVIVTNSDPGTTALLDDRFENTLDVEWSGAVAPGASIVLVTSSQNSQTGDALYASESYIINHNVAKVMSVSYGECELGMGSAGNAEYNSLWQQAYSQGIAVFVSSGDSAAAVCDDGIYNPSADYAAEYGASVSGMTSTPYNVSVGGTDFNNYGGSYWNGSNNGTNMSNATGYIPETPWNDTVTNPILIADYNSELGVNYSAEKWANYLLTNYGIGSGLYESVIPPVGGSGGVSNCTTYDGGNPSSCTGGYAKPSWQTNVTGIVSTDKRTVPDVSMFASNGFNGVTYLICDSQPPGYSSPISCSYPANAMDMAVGGTSVSSPVMAGVMALINQKAGATQGNPNANFYSLAAKQSYSSCSAETVSTNSSCYFNDIDTGTIAVPCYEGTTNCTVSTNGDALGILSGYAATTGYDKATGLGSLNVANVVNGWSGANSAPAGPSGSLSSGSLSYSSTNVGTSATTQTVTLTNSGTSSMTLTGVSISGTNASSFSETNTCGSTLAVSASCTATVKFTPTASGTLTASLNFADNAANAPQTVVLSGIGYVPTTVSTSVSSLSFTSPVNVATAIQTVTLHNSGSSAVSFTNTELTGQYATLFHGASGCQTSIPAGGSCQTNIYFQPTAVGTFSALLSYNDGAGNSPQTVNLSGTATGVPATTLSASTLSFGSINLGSSAAVKTVTLTNSGSATLSITSVTLTGANASAFPVTNGCSGTLAVSSSCTVSILYTPSAVGAQSATLTITDNASPTTQTVALSGTGVGVPMASLSSYSLSFAATNYGSSAASQTVTLTNTGSAALSVTSVSLSGSNASSFSEVSSCGSSVAINGSCTITVGFKPAATGALTAALSVADSASGSPQTVTLSGTGTGVPAANLSVTTMSFGSVNLGSSATAKTVTLSNTGNAPLTLNSVSVIGTNAIAFVPTNNCGATLAASSSCTVSITYTPSAVGAQSATLSFSDNAGTSAQTVALSGTGVGVPAVTLSPTSLTFAATNDNASSATQTVTVTNTGTAALTLNGFSFAGSNPTYFTETTSCGTSLAINASCTVTVTFKPTAVGSFTAALHLTDNAANSPQAITVSGVGQGVPAVSLSPTSLNFASTSTTIYVGALSTAQTVTLKNTGNGALIIGSISFGGSNPGSYIDSTTCSGTLAASASCTITVTFAPITAGTLAATLVVSDNAAGTTQSVTLSGVAVTPLPTVTLSTTSLSFAATTPGGVAPPAQLVTLTNTGKAALTFTSIGLVGSNVSSFNEISTCPASLAVNASCTTIVGFAPQAAGSLSARLTFNDNAASATQSVTLGGTGQATSLLSLSTSTLSFGTVSAGTTSVGQAVTLTNSGTGPVTLTSFALSGSGAAKFSQLTTCGTTLAANSSCLVMVEFAPLATGAASANLSVVSNSANGTAIVGLTGTGGPAPNAR